jgi:membrane-bound lytic murein transglycosylase B
MKDSYSGAMGVPQFMPSSFRSLAVDFDHDDHKDIWHNPNDAIASIANYTVKHHWQTGQTIAIPVSFKSKNNPKITLSS